MTFNHMKKIIITLFLCFLMAGTSFAQNNMQGMTILKVTALMRYGQNLYERGDYNEASAVFNHVLTFDAHQAQALQYLKAMGIAPVSNLSAPAVLSKNTVDVTDTKSLQQAIEAKKQNIANLQVQIKEMRARLAAQSIEQ